MIGFLSRHWISIREALNSERKNVNPEKLPSISQRDHDFLPAVLEITETPVSPAGRVLVALIISFFIISLAWAWIGHIDVIASAQGKTLPSDRVKVVQPLDAGIVRSLHVREGSIVRAGEILVELDPTESRAERDRLNNEYQTALLDLARFRALSTEGEDPVASFLPPPQAPPALVEQHRIHVALEWAAHLASLEALDRRIVAKERELSVLQAETSRLQRLLPSIRERVTARRPLAASGAMPRLTQLELEEELIGAEEQLSIQAHLIEQYLADHSTLQAERDLHQRDFSRQLAERLADKERQAESLRQELLRSEDRHQRQTLRAPDDGIIQQLRLYTIGAVVSPAEQLMIIVPHDGSLEVEAMVLNKDIGWVREGQTVEVKVDSFPFTRYGVVTGRLEHLSRDAILDEALGLVYPARILLEQTVIQADGNEVPLTPGMTVTAEIQIGQRRVADYVLAPLLRYRDESLRER